MMVQTVTGPIPVERLGRTLMHEHLFIAFPGAEFDPTAKFDRAEFIEEAVRRLVQLRTEHGVRSFVDPCPIELGRRARHRAARLSWCGRLAPKSAPAPRSCPVSIARSACSPCVRTWNCSSTVTPAPRYPVRRASAPVLRSPTIISRCRGCASMPISRSAARALSAPILLNRSSSICSPVSRKRGSATRQEISFRKRHGWSRRRHNPR